VRRGAAFAAAVGALAGTLLAVLPGAPASAHAADAPAATDYRTRLVAVTPRVPGVEVRVVENGARLELHNRTDHEVAVLGYSGEPYLRITPDGVFANTRSPATYLNQTLDGKTTPPRSAGVDTKAPPSWRRESREPVVRWHDHRTHWMGSGAPPVVASQPGAAHRVADWTVDLVANGSPVKITGTLDYAPPPVAPLWWAGMLLVAGAVVLAGRWRHGVLALGAALGLAAVAELVDGTGRMIDAGATGIGVLGALLTEETYGTLTALGALAAAVLAVRRSPVAPFALALAAACLGILGGATDVAVFLHAIAPVPWSGDLARVCTAATIALCTGVALAGWLRVRADRAPRAVPRASTAPEGTVSPTPG
jgi:hypothetical protein